MNIQKIGTGLLSTNTFIVESEQSSLIIDPDFCSEGVIKYLEDNVRPSAILLTHGHFDHFGGASALADHFNIPIYVHKDDEELLYDSVKNASYLLLYRDVVVYSPNVKLIEGGAELVIDDFKIKVYHTPGHTRGGVSYLIENHLFSGDLIFEGSYGRTDLYGGDFKTLMDSIRSLRSLGADTIVHTGHGRCNFTLAEYFGSMGM